MAPRRSCDSPGRPVHDVLMQRPSRGSRRCTLGWQGGRVLEKMSLEVTGPTAGMVLGEWGARTPGCVSGAVPLRGAGTELRPKAWLRVGGPPLFVRETLERGEGPGPLFVPNSLGGVGPRSGSPMSRDWDGGRPPPTSPHCKQSGDSAET